MASDMIITTTPQIEGRRIVAYHGIVSGEAILGANFVRDFFASVRDIVGGRSAPTSGCCAPDATARLRRWPRRRAGSAAMR
jgi:uncharacterized protein YbjQ (UPF0145 family)